MKYNNNEKPLIKGANRTLSHFKETMFQLLTEKEFEKISVKLVCEKSGYPRATFYNYFDDKYDLLNYCWEVLFESLDFNDHVLFLPEEAFPIYFKRTYQVFDGHRKLIKKLTLHNPPSSYLWSDFNYFSQRKLKKVLEECHHLPETDIEIDIVTSHIVNTIFLFLS